MKIFIYLLFFFQLFSCNNNSSQNKGTLKNYLPDFIISDDTRILGNWTMCSMREGDILISFNACSQVSFIISGTGTVNETVNFTWRLKENVLTILGNQKDSGLIFPDAAYNLAFTPIGNGRMDLVISYPKKDLFLYLSK